MGQEIQLEKRRNSQDVSHAQETINPHFKHPFCSVEALREYDPSFHIHHISPTPLLMTVADSDILTPTDMALAAYARALEPKELHIIPGGHFDGYSGPNFELNAGRQVQFLKKTLCA